MEQVREPDSRYQIGAGKVGELAKLVKEKGAEKVIFDNSLKPVQSYNLAKAAGVETIDRFQLILEIFTKRATTTEAQMQIKLAKLRRDLAQAKEKVRLAKKGEQPGFMGLGAYEADVYRESVKREVYTIRKKLKKIRSSRVLHRKRRAELGFSTVSLAGYTDAGKSSLFNALTSGSVAVDNELFTTLSTTTRLVEFSNRRFLLTDTVGFIDRLPLTLIEAFRSTLEETVYSDLIVLVVDVSESLEVIEKKLDVCLETIEQIGASGIPTITALNKTDLLNEKETNLKAEALKENTPHPVPISALKGDNIDRLRDAIISSLGIHISVSVTLPVAKETMPFISWLYQKASVQDLKYSGDSAHVILEATPEMAEEIRNRVRLLHGEFERI